ncbi:hypothetical protein QAD02_003050 [Eretmocerus hayati]|uniref:Uncharacterized protein n=2 Tax=Eretmocerus hayati TaxID=131215 RepID=A0ACC2NLJ1_9HYME|nr:hypothetical protein QAD02_003049 [Eretmocerus hayati]KAJ8671791.1 hypothetical protein QAD02_003050 [Eretmocerus hayati]
MDEGDLFPRKMRSGTDHNVEIVKANKRIGLERKIELDKLEELPSKVRCMNGDEVIELSRDDFKSEEAFRRFPIMKLINDRKVENFKQQNARKNQKISGFEELVKKLIDGKEFAAANFMEVSD